MITNTKYFDQYYLEFYYVWEHNQDFNISTYIPEIDIGNSYD